MITINSQLAKELNLTYWQMTEPPIDETFVLNQEEKELLRKILHAKAIHLNDDMLELKDNGIVLVKTKTHTLYFNDVHKANDNKYIHLAKLSQMLIDSNYKKLTWLKLKSLNFY